MKSIITKIFLVCVVVFLKISIIYFLNEGRANLNFDDFDAYTIANNIVLGKGQVAFNDTTNTFEKTARRGSFSIALHTLLIKHAISISTFVIFYYISYIILFIFSIFSFFNIAKHYIESSKYANIATIIYVIYPSTLIYVGGSIYFENIAICSVIFFFEEFLLRKNINYKTFLILTFAILSQLLRPHTVLIFAVLSVLALIQSIYNTKKIILITSFLCAMYISNEYFMQRNLDLVGHKITSTQSGFAFYQGHNPYARGSWSGVNWGADTTTPIVKYVLNNSKNYLYNSEFEQENIQKSIALNWALNNPLLEIELTLRKIAIFLLPQNFELNATSRWYNPLNLIIHLLFLGFLFSIIKSKRIVYFDNILLITPFFVCLGFSIIYFIGYRWRYYCEPFMIIAGISYLDDLSKKLKPKNRFGLSLKK